MLNNLTPKLEEYRTERLEVDIDDLYPADWNYKSDEYPPELRRKFRASILQDGSAGVLAVREVKGQQGYEVIDGNHRLEELRELGTKKVPVENFGYISKAFAITLARRRNHEWFPGDDIKYAELFRDSVLPEFSIDDLDQFMWETKDMLESTKTFLDFDWDYFGQPNNDEDAETDVFEPEKAIEPNDEMVSRSGDMWICGRHQILCGDAGEKAIVEQIINKKEPHLLFSDLPVNQRFAETGITGIDIEIIGNVQKYCQHGVIFNAHQFWNMFVPTVCFVVWQPNDDNLQLAWTSFTDRMPRAYDIASEEHENLIDDQKPLRLFRELIKDFCPPEVTLFDPFIGVGTTLIAAHQLKRRCVGIEIDPMKVDLAVKRFAQITEGTTDIYCLRDGKEISYFDLFPAVA